MRNSIIIAGVAAAVAALLLGGWFVFGQKDPSAARSAGSGPAPTTVLSPPSSGRPAPYPTVPSGQVRPASDEDYAPFGLRTGHDGRQLLVPVHDLECAGEEVRLLGEYPDRVEVEIRSFGKPPPPGATLDADGGYGCGSFEYSGFDRGPHAAVDLAAPLGSRAVIVHRRSG